MLRKILIVGLGFMGGSIAKAVKDKQGTEVSALDLNKDALNQAIKEEVIQCGYESESEVPWEIFNLIILCTPVDQTVRLLKLIDGKVSSSAIITDIGSTKDEIVSIAESKSFDFIGGHPMVGSEKTGYIHSQSHLFENSYYVLIPTNTTPNKKVEDLQEFVEGIGALTMIVSAKKHDLITAVISHVPHIVAASLVQVTTEFKDEGDAIQRLAAGGFKDITRIASSNPGMWEAISMSNSERIQQVLARVIEALVTFNKELTERNQHNVYQFFYQAKKKRDSIMDVTVKTDIPNEHSLVVDIEDKPGMIARISTLLYEQGINIKNIGIIHNRELENGALKVSLESDIDKKKAEKVLKNNSFWAL